MRKTIECKLVVSSDIDGNKDNTVVEGKGYYKDDNDEIVIYFSSENIKYKYIYSNNILKVYCNDSCYNFTLNKNNKGIIKSGNYEIEITTLAYKIDIFDNIINLDYELKQGGILIGKYFTSLSF